MLTTTALLTGTHTLRAVYAESGAVGGSMSPGVVEAVLASTFAVAVSPATMTLHAGQPGTATVTLTSVGAFAGPLTLGLGVLPTYAAGSLSPTSVSLSAGANGFAVLSLNTAQAGLGRVSERPGTRPGTRAWGVVFAGALLAPLGLARRRRLRGWTMALLAAVAYSGVMGCGTIGVPFHLVPDGTYQVPITATDGNGHQKTAVLTVVVMP